jgi:HlyD family secretion protein
MSGVVKKINTSLGSSTGGEEDDSTYDDGSGDNVYMTILALGDYRVKGKVSESNVWSLNEGDPVIVRSRVDENQTWKGSISEVKTDQNADSETSESSDSDYDYGDNSGESASKYNFYVKLDDDTGLMMGQHVLIEVDNGQDEEKEGIWLNSAYLHIDGEDFYVWAANSRDRLNLRKVTVGEYDEALDEYEIVKGLSIKDYIASDSEDLHENMRTTRNISEAESTEYYDEEENDDEIMYDDENQEFNDDMSDDGLFEDVDSVNDGVNNEDGSGLGPDQLDEGNGSKSTEDENVTVN